MDESQEQNSAPGPEPKAEPKKPALSKRRGVYRKKKIFGFLIGAVVLVLTASLAFKHITFKNGIPTLRKKEVVQQSVAEIPVPVKAFKVARIDFTDTLPALGTVKGYREVEMKFSTSGYIEYINFRDGEKAIEGDIIASLDQRESLLKLEYAKNEMDRNQELLNLGSIIEAKLQQSKLEYQSARLEYEKTNLVAPFDGYIGTVQKQKGDYVTPNDAFGTFVNLTDAYAEFGIIEKDINKVKIGQQVTLVVDSYPQDTFNGEIESISPMVEGKTRTFKVKSRVVNEGEKLKGGMFGRVGVLIYEKDQTLVIPSPAFRKKEDEYFAYVIHLDNEGEGAGAGAAGGAEAAASPGALSEEGDAGVGAPEGSGDPKSAVQPPAAGKEGASGGAEATPQAEETVSQGTIEIRPIQIAYATPDAVEIKAGLEEGELIVADLQQDLEEKSKVEVTEVQEQLF